MKTLLALLGLAAFLRTGDAAITAWTTPSIQGANSGSGTLSVAENQALNKAIETYVATTGATSNTTITYSLLTTGTPFAVARGGALTITSALDFETLSSYTLEIQAVDSASGSGTATIAVTVTDVNEAPTFTSNNFITNINDSSPAGTILISVPATDQDSGDTITYSIASGNIGGDFVVSSAGVITVATGKTLDACTTGRYTLHVEAVDDASPPLTGTTTVVATVGACSGSTILIAGLLTTLFASLVAIM